MGKRGTPPDKQAARRVQSATDDPNKPTNDEDWKSPIMSQADKNENQGGKKG